MRFLIDVDDRRACLQQLVVVRLDDGRDVPLDVVDIDTGSDFALLGPVEPWVPKDRAPQRVHTLGDTLWASRFEANLRFRDGPRIWDVPERIVVVVHARWDRWLVGLEVMRRFHLLLPREQLATADELP